MCLVDIAFLIPLTVAANASAQAPVAINLLYATNRRHPEGEPQAASFENVAAPLSLGTATIVVESEGAAGETQWPKVRSGGAEPGWVGLEPFPSNDIARLADALAVDRSDRTALLYVHGFMKSFSNAARDLADIVHGANYRGVPIVFSWPAGDSPLGYEEDTLSLSQSVPQLISILSDLSATENIEKIHLVAHSMGNQALLGVLTQLILSHPGQTAEWGEVILYAPDVDRAEFLAETLPVLVKGGLRPTLYVAEFDVPLLSSRVVNNGARLGDADAGIAVAAGMDTIDATPVAKFLDRHNHHLTRGSQADVGELLGGIEPADRTTLRARDNGSGRYWEIIGGEENAQ